MIFILHMCDELTYVHAASTQDTNHKSVMLRAGRRERHGIKEANSTNGVQACAMAVKGASVRECKKTFRWTSCCRPCRLRSWLLAQGGGGGGGSCGGGSNERQ